MNVFMCKCGGTLHLRSVCERYGGGILCSGFYECDVCRKRGGHPRDFATRGKNRPKRLKSINKYLKVVRKCGRR